MKVSIMLKRGEMKILSTLLSLVAFVTLADPQPQSTRVLLSCNRTRVQAVAPHPSDPMPLRMLGAGRRIKEWRICEVSKHNFKIEGLLMNHSSGRPCAGDIYIGNIAVTNVLTHLGQAATNGVFSVSVDVQTEDDISEMLRATNSPWILASPKSETTYAELTHRNRYLYTGRDGVALHAHSIPYEDFEQNESDVSETALRTAPGR